MAKKPTLDKSARPQKPTTRLTKVAIRELYARLAADRPDPKTELDFLNPYTLLVAVVLSAQATDKGVNRATRGLFAVASTPSEMVALGVSGVEHHIKTIGLWRAKAQNVVDLSRLLLERHQGDVPSSEDELIALPGVGRKTANVILNEAFGQPTIAVDTHIFRVSNRTGLAPGGNPDAVERELERITPSAYKRGAHHWLILHGRYVCVARSPKCRLCPIHDLCKWPEKRVS